MITLVITGVGGPLGQALIKSARLSAIPCRVVGTDRHELSIGLGWADQAYLLPDAAEPDRYLAELIQVCKKEGAALILPGSDGELVLLAQNARMLHEATGAKVVAASAEVLRVAMDKWETSRFLETAGLRCPVTSRLDDEDATAALIARFDFPLIAKPCRGSGSRNLFRVRSRDDLRYLRSLGIEMVVQEYLHPDEEEYTVGVYTQTDGRVAGSICFKRELCAGNTYRAWVDQNPVVLAEAEAITRALSPSGPCNVQLRLTARGPVAFEINPRFSGTTGMRAHFGFNEVEMAIRDFALEEPVPVPSIRSGIALRFWDEIYVDAPAGRPAAKIADTGKMRIVRTSDAEEWTRVLERAHQYDFYFLPKYHALAESCGEGQAHFFVYEEDEYMVALPLLLRRIADVPELAETAGNWHDATSVYGYAGPLASHEHIPEAVVARFQTALSTSLRELDVIAAFSRCHPVLPQAALLEGLGERRPAGQTVSIDLTIPSETQRARYRATIRTHLNRLARSGVTSVPDQEKRHLAEFTAIYHETMRRVGANDSYFFGEQYFLGLVESLGPTLQLFLVRNAGGEIIGAALFALCAGIVQFHLGGTRDHALKLSPMTLLIDSARRWANEMGARILHLGGGVGASADSLFAFKTGFSDDRQSFATWRWIIQPGAHAALVEKRKSWNAAQGLEPISDAYFPAYRCPTKPCTDPTPAHFPPDPADTTLPQDAPLPESSPALHLNERHG